MTNLDYDNVAAERLEAVYLGPDIVAQRKNTVAALAVQPGETVLDIGSGPGFLANEIADQTGAGGQVLGIDLSATMVTRAADRNDRSWLSFKQGDAADIPCEDSSFDVVVSTQVAEYVPDIISFCSEVFRVLKPGGRGLILATDWGSVCWHSSDPDRMNRVFRAFAPHCANIHLPRTLGARLRAAGLKLSNVDYFPIINIDRYPGCYSEMMVPLIQAYVKTTGEVPEAELEAWAQDLDDLHHRGEHFFSTGRYSFHITKPG